MPWILSFPLVYWTCNLVMGFWIYDHFGPTEKFLQYSSVQY